MFSSSGPGRCGETVRGGLEVLKRGDRCAGLILDRCEEFEDLSSFSACEVLGFGPGESALCGISRNRQFAAITQRFDLLQ